MRVHRTHAPHILVDLSQDAYEAVIGTLFASGPTTPGPIEIRSRLPKQRASSEMGPQLQKSS